jgi:hypothetical protein
MKANKIFTTSILKTICIVSGCARYCITEKLDAIELGMNLGELKNELGKGLRRGAIQNNSIPGL